MWVATAGLFVMTVASLVIQPHLEVQRGAELTGTTHSVIYSNGVMFYCRSEYTTLVYTMDQLSDSALRDLSTERWRRPKCEFELNSMSGLRGFASQSPFWIWFLPSRSSPAGFSVPLFLPLVVFAILSYLLLLSQRRELSNDQGLCVGCGYSLEGLDDGVCPECGGESGVG